MKILAISQEIPPVDWDSLEEMLKNEARALHEMYMEGHVREFYFTDRGEAVLVLESASPEEAVHILKKLPLVENGKIRFDLMELHPYSGFARLF
jgi:hypothetical protein